MRNKFKSKLCVQRTQAGCVLLLASLLAVQPALGLSGSAPLRLIQQTPSTADQQRQGQSSQPQNQTPADPQRQDQPGRTNQQPAQPGDPPPAQNQLPPNSNAAPIRPANEAQQSAQPQPGPEQQRQQTTPDTAGPRPVGPQPVTPSQQVPPGGQPQTSTPAGTPQPTTGAVPGQSGTPGVAPTPGQSVGTAPSIAPAELPSEPPVVAPGYEAPNRPLPSAERIGVNVSDEVPLTLEEAITLVLQNNNDLVISRLDTQLAQFDLRAARGVYDPRISSENYFERRVTPTSSIIGGGPNGSVLQRDLTGSARLGGFTPLAGGSYQLDFSSTRLTTNNQFVSLNPQFPTAATLTYTQPLWRGLRIDDNRRRIQIAKKNLTLSDAQFRQRAIEVVTRTTQAYWDLVFALRNLQVQIDAVRQARTQLESNRRQVNEGLLAPIDIVAASTQVTTFEQNVYNAQETVTRAENTLKSLLLADRHAALWSRALRPTTPVNLDAPRVPLGEAVSAAIANRPELAQLQASAEINEINTRYYRDQTRPQVDLIGTYSAAGLAGTPVPRDANLFGGGNQALTERVNELSQLAGLQVLPTTPVVAGGVPDALVGGYDQSLLNLLQQNYPTYRVGLRVNLPLFNRTAGAQLGRSLAEGRRIVEQRAQAEQLIEAEVRNTIQAVRSAEARLAAAAAARSSSEQQYESERRRFQAGLSTVFLVLQRQTDLLAARGRELQAQTDLNKAIAEFQRVTGNTLQANRITLNLDAPVHQLERQSAQGVTVEK